MTESLSKFEAQVMDHILKGNDDVLEKLRKQYENSNIKDKRYTGVGFFIEFGINKELSLGEDKNFVIDDVYSEIEGHNYSLGFLLYIKNGLIDTLEGYTYDNEFPDIINSFKIYYKDHLDRNIDSLKKKWE